MYFECWIALTLEGSSQISHPPEAFSRWIFALLSRVDSHISANDISQLRSLARSCSSLVKTLRASADSELGPRPFELDIVRDTRMSEAACWMIITVIAGFWGQSDLWVDAEILLSGL